MLFEKFVTETESWWTGYLKHIAAQQQSGNTDSGDGIILFPNILLVTECQNFLIAELLGATKYFKGLTTKRHKETSVYRYLSQFDDKPPQPLMRMDGHTGLRFVCLAQNTDFEVAQKRFPFIELYPSKLNHVAGRGSVLDFGENFSSYCVENSVLINTQENLYRCKSILELLIVKKNISRDKLINLFKDVTKGAEVKAVHTVAQGKEERLIVGGQFQSMYLLPGLHETTIGEFIRNHPEVIQTAFQTSHFIYEPHLTWLEHDGNVTDDAINPDLLVQRNDGSYDIYDLKTALLNKRSIFRGKRRRRRFIDCVEEGAAQLANYREYFLYPKNRKFAQEKYGIEVRDPQLILVVGNWDNVNHQEISEATRRYKNISIIDFDTLAHIFMGANEEHKSR
ncbi:MAG: DUF4263 domain-containing protein [Gammaproteobacteria bacterium]|nr:DUF4263 domain-containing protein [Gammaproteobacteria bacterium]